MIGRTLIAQFDKAKSTPPSLSVPSLRGHRVQPAPAPARLSVFRDDGESSYPPPPRFSKTIPGCIQAPTPAAEGDPREEGVVGHLGGRCGCLPLYAVRPLVPGRGLRPRGAPAAPGRRGYRGTLSPPSLASLRLSRFVRVMTTSYPLADNVRFTTSSATTTTVRTSDVRQDRPAAV